MKKIGLFFFASVFALASLAQRETFDLTSYTPPKGWKKEVKDRSYVVYSSVNKQKNTYCLIFIMPGINSKGGIKEDFESEWSLIATQYNVTAAPQISNPVVKEGWESKTGMAVFDFNGGKSVAQLTALSGYNKCVSIISVTNSSSYNAAIAQLMASVQMKKPAITKQENQPAAVSPVQGKFAFTTTNFDDGWVATEQADWVQVTKGTTRVLIHYPNKNADAYNSVLLDGLKNAWNILVAPKYSAINNLEWRPLIGWQSIEFAEADAVEKETSATVHVVLFKMNYSSGNGKYMEFITPDKASFEREFGAYHQTTYGWEAMEKMSSYNKFAVAASDLQGKWTTNFSGTIQYVNAYTGLDAAMDTHASSEFFQMGPGATYKWDLAVSNGPVGNIKFQHVKSSGQFSMTGNWQLNFSDIEGKPRSFNASFSCIKGLRILWLDDKAFAKAE